MHCFCGCGRNVAFALRSTNKRGERLRADVRRVEQLLEAGLASPNALIFVEQANEWCELFSSAVHVSIKPDTEGPGLSQVYLGWLAHVRPFVGQVGVSFLGQQVRDAGLSTDEALSRISTGEWDPYEDVMMPVPSTEGTGDSD
jgi:hypothetical protein